MSRAYTIDDTEMPSVTTVLGILDKSEFLIPWAVRACTGFIRKNKGDRDRYPTLDALLGAAESEWRTARDEAADIGSDIHNLIEKYIKNGMDAAGTMRPEVEHGFLAFLEWEKTMKVRWEESEMTIHHPELYYGGTLDAVAVIGTERYVIDFKSSNGFYDTFGPQIAAYREAFNYGVSNEVKATGCGILRLDKKTGIPEWKDYTKRQNRDFKSFSKLLDYYYAAAHRRLRNNPRCVEGKI